MNKGNITAYIVRLACVQDWDDEKFRVTRKSRKGARPQIRFEAISPGRFSEWIGAAGDSGGKH